MAASSVHAIAAHVDGLTVMLILVKPRAFTRSPTLRMRAFGRAAGRFRIGTMLLGFLKRESTLDNAPCAPEVESRDLVCVHYHTHAVSG